MAPCETRVGRDVVSIVRSDRPIGPRSRRIPLISSRRVPIDIRVDGERSRPSISGIWESGREGRMCSTRKFDPNLSHLRVMDERWSVGEEYEYMYVWDPYIITRSTQWMSYFLLVIRTDTSSLE